MKQLTEKQAIAVADSGVWKEWTNEQIVRFQLFQKRLCMDPDRFHLAVEDVLGRSVWTHEFADYNRIKEEYLGTKTPPSLREIMDMIPVEKRIVISINK